jgi:hypothetical protein
MWPQSKSGRSMREKELQQSHIQTSIKLFYAHQRFPSGGRSESALNHAPAWEVVTCDTTRSVTSTATTTWYWPSIRGFNNSITTKIMQSTYQSVILHENTKSSEYQTLTPQLVNPQVHRYLQLGALNVPHLTPYIYIQWLKLANILGYST